MIKVKRYLPSKKFPDYAHLPGKTHHPLKPKGHSYQVQDPDTLNLTLDINSPYTCPLFLFAVDLFNYGYYWESHVYWEALWHHVGRSGDSADFLKALIKLAAGGLKLRMGQIENAHDHLQRAAELLEKLIKNNYSTLLGLELCELLKYQELDLTRSIDSSQQITLPPLILNTA